MEEVYITKQEEEIIRSYLKMGCSISFIASRLRKSLYEVEMMIKKLLLENKISKQRVDVARNKKIEEDIKSGIKSNKIYKVKKEKGIAVEYKEDYRNFDYDDI